MHQLLRIWEPQRADCWTGHVTGIYMDQLLASMLARSSLARNALRARLLLSIIGIVAYNCKLIGRSMRRST